MADIASVIGGARNEIAELPWSEYKAAIGLNPSTIAHGLKSMRHLKHAWDNGRKDTAAMQWGRALHCLLFEPREFENRYRSWTGRRQGHAYEDFMADAFNAGAEVMTATGKFSIESALQAAESLLENEKVKHILAHGRSEVTLFATEGNVQCRGRIDWMNPVDFILPDLKTCANIEARAFGRDFYKYHYDLKLGLYRRWLSALTGKHWNVEVIAVENDAPYDVATIPVPEAVLDRGAARGVEIIERVEECIAAGVWPGVANGTDYYLDTPVWEQDEDIDGAEEWEESNAV